jgi:hypothetical protein
MNRHHHIVAALCLLWSAVAGLAQDNIPMPPKPVLTSPVELFRRLIATNAAGREAFLAGRSPEARRVIEAKLREYESLEQGEREAKLRSLQLRWYTQRFLRMKPEERATQMAQISPQDQAVIGERINRFKILPPQIQKEVMTNQMAMNFIFQDSRQQDGADARHAQRMERLVEFIESSPSEREKFLAKLTPTEHEQMQKTLSTFTSLSKEERVEAMAGFKKFAALSENERAAFLSTAERWRQMSDKDRAFWRSIVSALERARSSPSFPQPPVTKSAADSGQSLSTN